MLKRHNMSHFFEIYYPICKNCAGIFLNSVWQVKASFKKGTQLKASNKPKDSTCQ